MKYYKEKNIYVSEEGLIYDKINDEFVQRKLVNNGIGYLKTKGIYVHRLVWLVFKGPIPNGHVIDHIDGGRTNNKLSNLRCITQAENLANPITYKRRSNAMIGEKNPAYGKALPKSEFGRKFYEHYGVRQCDNRKLYLKELYYYNTHNKCSWE